MRTSKSSNRQVKTYETYSEASKHVLRAAKAAYDFAANVFRGLANHPAILTSYSIRMEAVNSKNLHGIIKIEHPLF